MLLWHFRLRAKHPALSLCILATDVEEPLLARARTAHYRRSSLREVPLEWIASAFARTGDGYELLPEFREGVEFRCADVRAETPQGAFDLILCRNLVCTYFDESLQRTVLARILGALREGGALVIGSSERLPPSLPGVAPWLPALGIFRRVAALPSATAALEERGCSA